MVIREVELFQGMSDGLVGELVNLMQRETLSSGTVLFRHGDPATHLYILETGRLELTMPGRRQASVVAKKPGDIVGWSSLAGRKSYSTAVTCSSESTVVKLERETLDRLLRSHPADGLLFYKHLAGVVGERLIMCHEAMTDLYRMKVA